MRRAAFLIIAELLFPFYNFCYSQQTKGEEIHYSQQSGFLENKGQIRDESGNPVPYVLFKAESSEADIYITENGFTYVLYGSGKENGDEKHANESDDEEVTLKEFSRVDVELKNATINRSAIVTSDPSPWTNNYYVDSTGIGIRNVRSYGELLIRNVYPGIDWRWYFQNGKLKYDFIVHPGADASQVTLLYKWADVTVSEDGKTLRVSTPSDTVEEGRIVSYAAENEVPTKYFISHSQKYPLETEVKFDVHSYDKTQQLTIDPPFNLLWGTYYGGNNYDGICDVTLDSHDNVFMVGYTGSTNFPTMDPVGGAYFNTNIGATAQAFILKFSPDGTLIWSTLFGGAIGIEYGNALAIDSLNDLFITGFTQSSDFPTLNPFGGAYFDNSFNNTTASGLRDAYIAKFDSAGVLKWSTYLGGTGDDLMNSMTISNSGNIFLVGESTGANYPLHDPGNGAFFQSTVSGDSDIVITEFSPAGVLLWSTFCGGSADEIGRSISSHPSGDIIVSGTSYSADFPLVNEAGAYNQSQMIDTADLVMMRFSPNDSMKWSTYLGGDHLDFCMSITCDDFGNTFLHGQTNSSDFPVVDPGGGAFYNGTFNNTIGYTFLGGNFSGILSRFNNNDSITWSTNLGSSTSSDYYRVGRQLACDYTGNLYLTFASDDQGIQTFDPGQGAYFNSFTNGTDAFDHYLACLTPSAQMVWGTYMGCNSGDWRSSVAIDRCGANVYFIGELYTNSFNALWNPGGLAYFVGTHGNNFGHDSFITKFSGLGSFAIITSQTNLNCDSSGTGSISIAPSGGTAPFTYLWTTGDSTATISGLSAGIYSATITDSTGCQSFITTSIHAQPAFTVSLTAQPVLCYGDSTGTITGTISGGTLPYSFSWNNGVTTLSQDSLPAGNYTLMVSDSTGCSASYSVSVYQPQNMIFGSYNYPPLCFDSTGYVIIPGINGGVPDYDYSWNTGDTTQNLFNLPGGTYYVTATDQFGCTYTDTVLLPALSVPVITTDTFNNISCSGFNNGSIYISVNGGNNPYTLQWNPGNQNTSSVANLSPGTYTVTATDQDGCIDSLSYTLTDPPLLTLSLASSSSQCSPNTGSIMAIVGGGTPGYDYNWSSGLTQQNISGLAPGNYTLAVTDTNGCTISQSTVVNVYPNPTAGAGNSVTIAAGQSASLVASGGGNYLWDNGDTNSVISVSPVLTTSYCVLVTDSNNCTDSACVTVVVECDTFYIPTAFSPNGDGHNEKECVLTPCNVSSLTFRIFDRWGEKVFETNDLSLCWDGTYKGSPVNTGVFTYYMTALLEDGTLVQRQGKINLVR